MAIQTIKATMQMRYGLEEDLEPDQLTTGEWAVSTDTKYVRMCFAPGIVLRMATYEAFEQDMVEIQTILATCRDIQAAVERFEQLAEQHTSQAEEWSVTSKSWAVGGTGTREGEDTDNSKYYSERSKNEADRAKDEADRAAAIVGNDVDSELSETSANPVQNKVITKALKEIDISEKIVHFEESEDMANIESGELLSTLFGKTKKWFSELKRTAFLSVINNLIAEESGIGVLDAHQGKVLDDKITELNRNMPDYKVATSTSNGLMSASDKKILDSIGTGTYAEGTYTTKAWAAGTINGCTWVAPETGIYIVWTRFILQDDTYAKIYKQFQQRGTASILLATTLQYNLAFQYGGISAATINQPVSAAKGQTVEPYIHTDTAGVVFNVKTMGIRIK